MRLRSTIARLTPIDDDVSLRVQQQYEENPYPRWVHVASGVEPIAIDQHLRNKFPTAAFTPLGKTEDLDILGRRLRHRLAIHRGRAKITRARACSPSISA